MINSGKCVFCGMENGGGMVVMGHYVCLECQTLLDDPHKRVFGNPNSRRYANARQEKRGELVKTRD